MTKVLHVPFSTFKRRRPSDLLTPGSQKWVDRAAPLKVSKWKSKEEFATAAGRPDLLDKLAQLSQAATSKDLQAREMLKKRAKAKYFTNAFLRQLISLDSPLQKAYINSLYCSTELKQDGDKITTQYCKNRWCQVCNRIRIAKCINGYMPGLQQLTDPQFVTLTIPNMKRHELRPAIRGMIQCWQAIYKKLHRQCKAAGTKELPVKLIGIRKMECTYNAEMDTYHPHFHFIVEHEAVANTIVSEWLQRNPTATPEAQKVSKADAGTMIELFKYFTKVITKGSVYISAADVIFQSMQGYRVYQPFGIQAVNEEPDDLDAITLEENFEGMAFWKWNGRDWINNATGEALTNFNDTVFIDKLFENVVL